MKTTPLLLLPLTAIMALPCAVFAHPHNSPFTFIKHTMSDGHAVYTNIPQSCFSDGVMTCWNYHPVAGNPGGSFTQPTTIESGISMQEPLIQVKEPETPAGEKVQQ